MNNNKIKTYVIPPGQQKLISTLPFDINLDSGGQIVSIDSIYNNSEEKLIEDILKEAESCKNNPDEVLKWLN